MESSSASSSINDSSPSDGPSVTLIGNNIDTPASIPPLEPSYTAVTVEDGKDVEDQSTSLAFKIISWERLPVTPRVRRPETTDHGLWKIACQERVESLCVHVFFSLLCRNGKNCARIADASIIDWNRMRRFGKGTVEACVVAQSPPPSPIPARFRLYTPDSCTRSDGTFFDSEMDEEMLDFEDDEDEDDDLDFEEGVDEETMVLDESPALGFDVMDVDVDVDMHMDSHSPQPEDPISAPSASSLEAPAFAEEDAVPMLTPDASPSSQTSSSPSASPPSPSPTPLSFPETSPLPSLPPLSSIPVPCLEPFPYLGAEGRSFMGRGTPIDKQRSDDWVNVRFPERFPGTCEMVISETEVQPQSEEVGKEDWAQVLFLPVSLGQTPSESAKVADMSEMSFDMTGGVSMFGTQFGQPGFGESDALGASFAMDVETSPAPTSVIQSIHYPSPSSDMHWLDPSLRLPSESMSPSPPEMTPDHAHHDDDSNNTNIHSHHHLHSSSRLVPMQDEVLQAQGHHTGCQVHSSFLQCLLGTGAGCGCGGLSTNPVAAPGAPMSIADVGLDIAVVTQSQPPSPQVPVSSTLSHALG